MAPKGFWLERIAPHQSPSPPQISPATAPKALDVAQEAGSPARNFHKVVRKWRFRRAWLITGYPRCPHAYGGEPSGHSG
jgi:hypothetical protein